MGRPASRTPLSIYARVNSEDATITDMPIKRRCRQGDATSRESDGESLKWTGMYPYGRDFVYMDAIETIKPAGLDEVLGSTARVRVARLLIELPDKEFTGREIARLLGTGHSTILPALRALVDRGLVNERVLGRAHVFRVNRDHFLYSILAATFGSERKLVEEITELIRSSLAAGSKSIVLFGSRAKGEARTGSDIDLLIVSREVRDTEAALGPLRAQLRRRFGLELDAKVLSPAQLRSKAEAPYLKAARTEGLLIAGAPLGKVRTDDN